jgi:hypothetical protein
VAHCMRGRVLVIILICESLQLVWLEICAPFVLAQLACLLDKMKLVLRRSSKAKCGKKSVDDEALKPKKQPRPRWRRGVLKVPDPVEYPVESDSDELGSDDWFDENGERVSPPPRTPRPEDWWDSDDEGF